MSRPDRFGAVVALSDNPIVVLDRVGCLVDMNPFALSLFGVADVDAYAGADFFNLFVAARYREVGRSTLAAMLADGRSRELEHEVVSLRDERITLMWHVLPPRPESDSVRDAVLLVGKNLTHERHMEQLLEQSSKLIEDYKYALDQSAIVAIADTRGHIIYANDKFCEISRYSREELLGQNHRVVNSGYHDRVFFQTLWTTITAGHVWRGEIRNRAKTGELFWVDTTIVPFLDARGRPFQYVSINFDLTEKKLTQARLLEEQVRTHHAEKMASLGELAAGIAHELGNPLASITAWLGVISSHLEKGLLDRADFSSTVPSVMRKADRMSKIIRGMLSYARDGSQDPYVVVNVERLISEVREYSTHRATRLGIELRVKPIPQYLDAECRETEISQILVNLLLNASDAVREHPERWIEVAAEEDGSGVAISVTDSGPGVPLDLREKIMEPFFTTKPLGKGTGLGLSIAKKLADHHNGKLVLDPQSSSTRFVLWLPRRQPKPDAATT